MSNDSFGARNSLRHGDDEVGVFRLDALAEVAPDLDRLPYSLKVLLENLLRHEDGVSVTGDDIEALARWSGGKPDDGSGGDEREIAFMPARVLMQDFTGVPAVVDLAAMRDGIEFLGGDPTKVSPLIPADLVIDHSVSVDVYGTADSAARNAEIEFGRNA